MVCRLYLLPFTLHSVIQRLLLLFRFLSFHHDDSIQIEVVLILITINNNKVKRADEEPDTDRSWEEWTLAKERKGKDSEKGPFSDQFSN